MSTAGREGLVAEAAHYGWAANLRRGERTGRPGLWRRAGALPVLVSVVLALMSALVAAPLAGAATPLNIFVGYMDTHTTGSSSKQPSPWPYTDTSSYKGSPCSNYPNSTTCWDSSALRLDNPGSTDVTGVHPVVVIGSKTYDLWGSNLTVKAHGMLVLPETGAQNSENFDGSDYPPNAYNGGSTASCANSGAIPAVQITIAGATTKYLDSAQVLNTFGVDGGHCLNGKFVSGRMDESHPWVQIGSGSPTAPTAPQSLAGTAGSGAVTLSWGVPASDGGSPITGYNIYRGTTAGGESSTPVATNVTVTGFTNTGLTNGATYYYTVSAVNAVGISPRSNETSATPQLVQASVPTAPRSLAAVAGSGSVGLSWLAPTSNGGSAITGYNVYRGTTAGGESSTPLMANVTATSITDNSPANGTTYYYKVAAVNAMGTSPQSNEASSTPQATAPSAPLTLVASAGDATVALSWAPPLLDGGSPITGYNIYRGTTAGGEASTPVATNVTTTVFTDTGLTNGTRYYYEAAAVNAMGTSPQSNEASATPQRAATVPTAPQGLTAATSNRAAQLSWTVPVSDGGSAVNGYNVYRGTSPGGESATPVASNLTTNSFADTGLTNGTTYFYTVAAVNAVGTSPPSNEASTTPQPIAPSAPLTLVASPGQATVGLSWSLPASDGGSPITGYNIYRGTTPQGESATPVATNVTTTSFADTGLTNGTTYYYKVAATNAVGTSPQSGEASATPQAPPPPSTTIERRIGTGTDDAEESATGTFSGSSSDLELVYDGSNQQVGMRFPTLAIPAGATITKAYIQFEADEAQSEATTLAIRGQSADNPATFSSTNKISTRLRTTAAVSWSPAPWALIGEVGANQRTPDLSPVIQEIVSRPAWATGNAMALIITGTGHRTARAYEGKPAGAPLLHIEFSTGPVPNQAPVVNAGPDQSVTLSAGAVLDGTVTDDGQPTPTLTTTWTQLSGPGNATFANPAAVDTTATFTATGTYVLQLAATDGLLSSNDTAQITVASAQAPTARLAATPTTGTAPVAVAADASTSTDPQGQALTYAFNYGDGTTVPAGPAATGTHTYATAGTYALNVTVTNTSGLTSSASATITVTDPTPPSTNPPAYVSQIATNYSTSTKTTGYITVWRSAGVQAGNLVLLTLQLSGTAPTGPVSATDAAGNTYTLTSSVANTAGGRLVVLSGVAVKPLAVGARITATFSSATGYRMLGDEFSGVSRVDATASATGTATTFSSGPTPTSSAAREVVYGSVAVFGGTANPAWATGWSAMTSYAVVPNYLGRAYRLPTATGTFTATGTASGSWLASTVTFAP